ncbi:hypothetical protein BU15DRAFT_68202 [Melanogaster broomeanus]|nr:hypothetical protein BU15DRAFT_68202 [Melanogaster broomeanus]
MPSPHRRPRTNETLTSFTLFSCVSTVAIAGAAAGHANVFLTVSFSLQVPHGPCSFVEMGEDDIGGKDECGMDIGCMHGLLGCGRSGDEMEEGEDRARFVQTRLSVIREHGLKDMSNSSSLPGYEITNVSSRPNIPSCSTDAYPRFAQNTR